MTGAEKRLAREKPGKGIVLRCRVRLGESAASCSYGSDDAG